MTAVEWMMPFAVDQIQRKLDAVRCMNKPLHDAERQLRVRLDAVHRSLGPPQQALKDLNSALLQVGNCEAYPCFFFETILLLQFILAPQTFFFL